MSVIVALLRPGVAGIAVEHIVDQIRQVFISLQVIQGDDARHIELLGQVEDFHGAKDSGPELITPVGGEP